MTTDLSTDRVVCLQLHLGGDRNFHYLLGDPATRRAAAVDPGYAPARFAALAEAQGLVIDAILITHGHADHTGGAAHLAALTGAPVLAGAADAVPGAQALADGQTVTVGGLAITALATPGHAPDHFCFLAAPFLVTGDLLFCGKVGGTGAPFPGSSAQDQWASLQKVLALPDETVVLPGHDYYGGPGARPQSTVGHERAHNPFLAGDFAAFCHLKETWAVYKKEHGIR
ncbi:MAG: hydroxyacylglutathione hydrolase family protein [Candidatus Krumholzibacteriia bacterium]